MDKLQSRGAVLLLNVLVMGVISIAATAVLARGSLDSYLDSATALSAWNTRADVFGCLDEALIQIKKDNDFSGAVISTGEITCNLVITAPASGQRLIILGIEKGGNIRQLTALVTLDPYVVNQVTEP